VPDDFSFFAIRPGPLNPGRVAKLRSQPSWISSTVDCPAISSVRRRCVARIASTDSAAAFECSIIL